MSARKNASPWTEKLIELLSDGEWHDYKVIRDEAAMLVPAHIAFHAAEKSRVKHYVLAGREPEPRHYGSKGDTILSGQRRFVSKSLQDLRRRGRVEIEYGDQEFRKRPVRVRLAR